MSLKSVKEIGKNEHVVEIAVDAEAFTKAVTQAYKKNVKKINVPGFRKGKAPQGIVEKMYGEGVFFEDAIDIVLPEAYEEAIKESKLEPVNRPAIDVVSVDRENGLVVTATFFSKPEVVVKDYKGIKAKKVVHTVTEPEVLDSLQQTVERNARIVDVTDRPAIMGDTVIIDFEGSIDSVPFEGGKGEDFSLELGSGQFIPGFEEQVAAHEIGTEFEVNVPFPEDYHAKELAGKDSVFKVTIKEIKGKEFPELDDEFAKDVSEYDTLEEYKAAIKEDLGKISDRASQTQMENDLVDQVIEKMEGDIPEVMYETRIDEEMKNFDFRLQQQGMNLETYMQFTGTTQDAMRLTFKEQAEKQVKVRLALEKIVEMENIEATEEDMNKEYEKLAEGYQMPVDQIKAALPADQLEMDVKVNKAVDLIRDNAIIEEVAEELEVKEEKKPAKKTATKKTTAKKDAEKKETPKKKAPAKKATTKKKEEPKEDK